MSDRLFVYGSLRSTAARPLASWSGASVRCLGAARIRGRLYDLGAYPGVVDCPRSGWVRGELYELRRPRRLLARLDRYEGGQYRRVRRPIYGAGGQRQAWVYLLRRPPRGRRVMGAVRCRAEVD